MTTYFLTARSTLALSLPILISQLAQNGFGIVDTIMAGNAGVNDLAGVGLGSSVWSLALLFIIGILLFITPKIAELNAQNKISEARHLFQQAHWLALLLSMICIAIVWLAIPYFHLLNSSPETLVIFEGYIFAILWGIPALAFFFTLRFALDGLEIVKPAMVISILGGLLNIPLNYALIYGHWGAPELGGVGCGWATTISMWFMLLSFWGYVIIKKPNAIISLRIGAFDIKSNVFLFKKGLPISLSILLEASSFLLIAFFVAGLGDIPLGANQVTISYTTFLFIIPLSIGMAMTIRIGHYWGKQDIHALKHHITTYLIIALALGLMTTTFTYTMHPLIAQSYSDNFEIIELAGQLLILAAMYQISDAIQITLSSILKGLQDVAILFWIALVTYWVVTMPLGYYLAFSEQTQLGVKGYWMAIIVGLTLSAILLSIRLKLKFSQLSQRTEFPLRDTNV